jgi:hypothetical protein
MSPHCFRGSAIGNSIDIRASPQGALRFGELAPGLKAPGAVSATQRGLRIFADADRLMMVLMVAGQPHKTVKTGEELSSSTRRHSRC